MISSSFKIQKTTLLYLILVVLLAGLAGLVQAKLEWVGTGLIGALLTVLILAPAIVKNPLNGLILMGFFLPFEYTPSLTIANITFKINHLVAGLTLLSWLIRFVQGQIKISLKFNPAVFLVTVFFITQVLSLSQAIHSQRAWQVLIFLAFTLLIFLLFSSLVHSKEDLTKILQAVIWGALVTAGFAIFQFFGDLLGLPLTITRLKPGYDKTTFGFPRVQSLLSEPLYFANYLFLPLFLLTCWWLAETGKNILKPVYQLLTVALLFILLILTVSRGAYLGLVAGLILLWVINLPLFLKLRNLVVVLLTGLFIASGVLGALYFSESRALEEFIAHATVQDFQKGESVPARLKAMQEAYQGWQESPLLGIGLGNYGPYAMGYPEEPPSTGWVIVNNQYLETLCETGILGLTGLILFLLVLLWRNFLAFWRCQDRFLQATTLALLVATVAVFVQYNTFSTIYILPIWFLLGLNNTATTLALEKTSIKPLKSRAN